MNATLGNDNDKTKGRQVTYIIYTEIILCCEQKKIE